MGTHHNYGNCSYQNIKVRTLCIPYGDTYERSKHKVPYKKRNESKRHTEDRQEEITDGKIQEEHICNGPHSDILHQCQNHQAVAKDSQ